MPHTWNDPTRAERVYNPRVVSDPTTPPRYLEPYLAAVREHGGTFRSLLWSSPETQSARFRAITDLVDFTGKTVLDAGCGRADFLDHLQSLGWQGGNYIGLEAVPVLAAVAQRKMPHGHRVVEGDFIQHPELMRIDAGIIVFCGSLNTLDRFSFYLTLRHAIEAAPAVVFNFLSSAHRAGGPHLTWHDPQDVIKFTRGMGGRVRLADKYLKGDCLIHVER